MTHPLTLWLTELLGPDEPDATNRAENALVGLLRHPAMREPSEAVWKTMTERGQDTSAADWYDMSEGAVASITITSWRAGCDALAREIEEANR